MLTIDLDSNFWEVNNNLKYVEPFKTFYKEDKTSNKKRSSSILWISTCYLHPDSVYINIDSNERYESICEGWLGSMEFFTKNEADILKYTSIMEEFIYNSPAKKALKEWEEKMIQRAIFIKDTPYTADGFEPNDNGGYTKVAGTHKMLDDMMKATKGLYDDYFRIKAELDKTSEEKTVGNRKKSFLETERQ